MNLLFFKAPYDSIPKDVWDRFCLSCPYTWFWHTTYFIDYLSVEATNLSFGVATPDGELISIFPLVFRDGQEVDGYPLPQPVLPELPDPVSDYVDECVAHLLDTEGVPKYRIRESPLAPVDGWKDRLNRLRGRPGEPTEFFEYHSVVADLREPEAKRWSDVRSSYRPLINRMSKVLTFHAQPSEPELLDEFRAMHEKERGGPTRPAATWEEMRRWVRDGYAGIFGAKRDKTWVGFALIISYKGHAYYGVGASIEPNVMSYILWETQKYLACYEYQYFEIGWADVGTTPKEKAIEFFKQGMAKTRLPWMTATFHPQPIEEES